MQLENEGQSRIVDTLHNQDKALKESLNLFKGRSLDFLDKGLTGKVTDILGTEMTETSTKKAYGDNAFKLSTNMGFHNEWEASISMKDMMRICSYNIDLSRLHGIPFTTVIVTTKNPSVTEYKNPSLIFRPIIINLRERDADAVLLDIEKKLTAGEYNKINELEIIYLPLYGSKSGKSTAELLDTAIKLAPRVAHGDKQKRQKLQDLLILLVSTFVSNEELNKILEDNMRILEDNRAIRVLEERGERRGFQQGIEQGLEQGLEQTARNMLLEGEETAKISRITGLSLSRIIELQNELQSQLQSQ